MRATLTSLLTLLTCAAASIDESLFHSNVDDTTISVGDGFACALAARDDVHSRIGGVIKCWGPRAHADAAPPGVFVQLSASADYACGLRSNRSVACWHPMGTVSEPEARAVMMLLQPAMGVAGVMQLSSGGSVMCAVTEGYAVACWGRDTFGQTQAPKGRHVQVSCGRFTCCGINGDGGITCWGQYTWSAPQPPLNDSVAHKFVQVSVSEGPRACAVDDTAAMWCWGAGFTRSPAQPPTRVPGSFIAVSVTMGVLVGVEPDGHARIMLHDREDAYSNRSSAPSPRASTLEVTTFGESVCALLTEPAAAYDGVLVRCFGPGAEQLTPPLFYPAMY